MIKVHCIFQSPQKSNLLIFSVKENVLIGENVGQIDSPGFPPPFEVHDFQDKKFIISKTTGIIKVAGLIDREKQNIYLFLVISMNGDTKNIQIKILDVNDNEPKFNMTNFEKSIPENYPIGSKVDLTTVYDPDEGKNSIQTVKIISGDSEKMFAIDYHDGSNGIFYIRLILKQSLDYETISQFNLVIQAMDGGNPPLQASLLVKIIVLNANDNVPKFDISRYIASIKEDQEVNKTFLRVRATDNDAGVSGELFYFLDNNSPSSEFFAIDHKTGNFYLRKSVDFEKSRSHHISIGVRDNSPPFHTSKVPVIIDIIDINDNPPLIQIQWIKKQSEINRDIDPNTIVAHVKLTDYDAISTSFDLEILNESPFRLNKILPKIWELKLINEIGNYKANRINFTLKAVDFPEPSLSTTETFSIKIHDSVLFENSFAKNLFKVEIDSIILNENHHIMTLKTTKKLPIKTLFLFKVFIKSDLFKINQTTGEIFSKRFIDCGNYFLNVSMLSLKTNSIIDETKVEIIITSYRKFPLYFEKGFLKILITVGKNQCFPEIAVRNRHCGMRVQYSFDLLLKTDEILRIDEHGALCTTETVKDNKLLSNSYLYKLKALDENNSSAVCIVLFAIQPSNTFIVLPKNINITLPIIDDSKFDFSFPIGKIVGTFTGFPSSRFLGFIQYQIVLEELSTEFISIDNQSGEIMMKKFPIHKNPMKLIVKTMTMNRINESPMSIVEIDFRKLYFSKSFYQFILIKSSIIMKSFKVGQVSVDSSWTESVSYYLFNGQNHYSHFSIDSATGIIIGKDLNSISEQTMVFQVCAKTQTGQISYSQVIIHIEDIVHQPVFEFSNMLINVWENTTIGIEIMQVFPKYSSESDKYQIVQSQFSDWISIHSKTGQIYINKRFDRETINYLVVTVKLTNQIGSASLDLHLNILDINDNKPNCINTKINFTVQDNLSVGEMKCPLQCSDVDSFSNGNLTYQMKIVKPVGMNNPFSITQNTGCLVIISSLNIWNFNPSGFIHLLVIVSDNGPFKALKTEVEIFVKIIDSNNHSPSLISTNVFYIDQTAPYGTEVGTLLLKDDDIGENGEIDISIKKIHHKQCFYIEKLSTNTFILRVKYFGSIKSYLEQEIVLLTATDRGSPSRSSVISIIVNILESNQHSPLILVPNQNKQIIFSCPLLSGSEIFTVNAIDQDKGLNSRFKYSIKMLNEYEDYINIDCWTGLIATRVTLSCAQNIGIRIYVSDLGYPKRTSYVDTYLKPLYEPKSDEIFTNKNFTFIIPDNSQPGYIVGDLNIFPEIYGAKCVFISNATTSIDGLLHLQYDTQQLILLKDNRKLKNVNYPIIVVFNKKNLFTISTNFYVNLIINRAGFSWPLFSKDSRKILEIKENLPTGSHVATFTVVNLNNLEVIYSIKQLDKYFIINPKTGDLVIYRVFDRESLNQIQFYIEIVATHVSNPKIFSVLPVKVQIIDENDNFPYIMSPTSSIVRIFTPIPENTVVFRVVARDADIGRNSQLKYQINSSLNKFFQINEYSGEIYLVSTPRVSAHELNVTVRDSGEISKSISVVFSIYFQSIKTKSKIRFLSNTLSMNLSLPQSKSGFTIGKLSYLQTISTANLDVRYYLIAGKFAQIFTIDPITGVVKTQHPVSREEIGNSEIVQITAIIQSLKDQSIYDLGTISLNIDYGNENTPKFSRSIFKVKLPEDEAITNFLTVVAHDPDLGIYGKITYTLEGDTFDKKIFIDPLTGRLSCSPLNYMEKNLYNLKVIATDSEDPSSGRKDSTKVIIFVQNTKQHTFTFNATHFSLKVLENAPGGTILGRINIVKPPTNSEIFYILNPGHSHIRINCSTGELKTNGPIHLEFVEFIELTIHAFAKTISTGNIQTTSAIIDVRIIDINNYQPIPSENPVKIFVPDSNNPQKPLTKLSATDSDKTSNITYQLDLNDHNTQSLASMYLLDRKSGNLFLKSSVPSTEKIRHFLKVIVADNGVPNRYTVVLIDIILNRDHEYLQIVPEKAIFRVKENSIDGTFIGQLKLINYCQSQSTKFSIIDGVNHELVFLHESTGKIFVAASAKIDREKIKKIILWTQVSCGDWENRGYKKVVIHVDDIDDNKPIFSQANFFAFLNEGQPPRTPVIRVTVYDPDIGFNSQVEYFIEFYSSQEEFLIDTNGEIKTNIPLNFHTKSVYDLVIKASSKSSPFVFAECRLTVYVININDQRPKISLPNQTIKLDTNTPVGSLITKITVKDSDGPDGISYRIRHKKLTNQTLFLNVAYDSGEIFLSRKLSNSDIGKHELDIVVDDAKFLSTAVIEIDVEDKNNHVPILRENGKRINLSNLMKRGSIIMYLHADDKDHGDNGRVAFELISSSPWFGLRGFDNNTAVLFLIDEPTDKEHPYFLGIQLTDNAIDPRKRLMSISVLTILLKYANSNSPRLIGNDSTEISISESVKSGSKITKFVCKDLDSNRSIWYKIDNSYSISNYFYVDSESGDLFLTKSLNYSIQPRFLVSITCAIVGSSEKATSFNLSIHVENENQRSDLLENKILTLSLQIPEMIQKPAIIANLLNTDKNSYQYSYHLVSVAPEYPDNIYDPPNFQIDSSNILWWISGNLFENRIWNLTIMVINARKYQNTPSNLYENGYLFINLEVPKQLIGNLNKCVDINRLTGLINENEPPKTTALKLPIWYHDIQYSLASHENFELFCSQSDKSNCQIKSKTVLDFETHEHYRLQLLIKGSYFYSRSCTHSLMVEISVLDTDEYFPEFLHQSYNHNVDGGIPRLGQILFTVHATDKDRGRFGLVSYRFAKNPSENFDINNETGAIFIKTEFTIEKESRVKRSMTNEDVLKSYRKSFHFRISASSGVKTSYAYVELTMLVPGMKPIFFSKLTEMQIILISTVPIGIIIIIIVCIVLYLLKRNYLCKYMGKGSKYPSSHTESPRTSYSLNTNMSIGSLRGKPRKRSYDKSPDISQMPLSGTNYNLPHSDTQDFNLSCDEIKFTTCSYDTNDQRSKYGHSSDTSIKTLSYLDNNNSLQYTKMNCDSGIGHNQRSYDDSERERMRVSRLGLDQNKHQDSYNSLNSSGEYSSITNNQQKFSTVIPSGTNIPVQQSYVKRNSFVPHEEYLDNFPIVQFTEQKHSRFPNNKSGRLLPSTILKNSSDFFGAIPMENLAQNSDFRNNNHSYALLTRSKFSEDEMCQLQSNCYPCQNNLHTDEELNMLSSNPNTISSNITIPVPYNTQPYEITDM